MCSRISSSKTSSSCLCAPCAFTLAQSIRKFSIASPLPFESQHFLDYACHTLPVLRLPLQLPGASCSDRVEPRPPIVLARPPLRRNPSLLLKPEQCRVDSPLIQVQNAVAHLLDPPRNPKSVQWSHGIKRLQNHQVQRSLQYL